MSIGPGSVEYRTDERGVVHVDLDHADRLHALTIEMMRSLEDCLRQVDPVRTRALVLRTVGTAVFSVGADLRQVRDLTPVEMDRTWLATGHRVLGTLAALPCPTVAVIDGLALGGGLELALACDLRVMSDDARIGLPETGIGAIPGWGGATRVTQLVGAARAADLMLTRRQLSAAEALDWGLVSRVAGADALEETTAEIVDAFLAGSPVAQRLVKSVIAAAAAGTPAHLIEPLAGGVAQASADLVEGTSAFFDKRPPTFTNH